MFPLETKIYMEHFKKAARNICNDHAWLKVFCPETTTNGENSRIFGCFFLYSPFLQSLELLCS